MTFDTPDFNAQLQSDSQALFNTVLHEMGHILGIGTLWRPDFLANPVFGIGPPNPNNQPIFTGQNAIDANALLTAIGASEVFVENRGGQGTAGKYQDTCAWLTFNTINLDAHWEESVYGNELMTGFLNPGANPMSVLTLASLRDIGLAVDECVAQSFGGFTPDPEDCANRTFEGFEEVGTSPPSSSGSQDLTPWAIAGITIGALVGLILIGLVCNGLCGLCGLSSSTPQGEGKPAEPQKQTYQENYANDAQGAPAQSQQNQNINLA